MLDTVTMRVLLAVVALLVLLVFLAGTYRRTRSRYAAWWSVSLLLSGLASVAYLFNGTALQVVFNPVGNVLSVVGAGCVWFAARAVRGRAPLWWVLAAIVAVVALAAYLDDPLHDAWTGGEALLAGMLAGFVLAAREVAGLWRERRRHLSPARWDVVGSSLLALLVAGTSMAALYVGRLVAFVVWGPEDARFDTWFGAGVTTLAMILMLVVTTFGVTSISHYESARDVRRRAAYDSLTGLLTRAEFLDRAEGWRARRGHGAIAVVADLDRFKQINDALGHEAGDRALRAFGAAARESLVGQGICGRLGGEEFAMLLETTDLDRAHEVLRRVSERYALGSPVRLGAPTASYGVTIAHGHEPVAGVLARADAALYLAKSRGRDRVEVDSGGGV
ncbi:diguanylate cyclase [Demequina sp. NBRC 110054]|uniref:GGDEF domain-containing protein n=1 Tax=Demequina sp. NBRC 110054 TaxID=1570343 RepID=UPI000A0103D8|nr:GGDEF domain-containing protein [Demequina sp. NBRC 110054]